MQASICNVPKYLGNKKQMKANEKSLCDVNKTHASGVAA